MGAHGMLDGTSARAGVGAVATRLPLQAPALTVGGSTSEVLRNVIGERLLGLPHDVDVELGRTWREVHSSAGARE